LIRGTIEPICLGNADRVEGTSKDRIVRVKFEKVRDGDVEKLGWCGVVVEIDCEHKPNKVPIEMGETRSQTIRDETKKAGVLQTS
jgi:hypothetical protein